jgi:hypothetical protein
MSEKTVIPPDVRPEVQEIADLTDALKVWRYGGGSIDLIESKLLRFASLVDAAIDDNAPPWSVGEAPVMGRAIAVLFDLGYLMHPNWATVYAKSFIAHWKRGDK